jgi:hypothetical protein
VTTFLDCQYSYETLVLMHGMFPCYRPQGKVRSSGAPPPAGSGQQSYDSEDDLDKDLMLEWERKVTCSKDGDASYISTNVLL